MTLLLTRSDLEKVLDWTSVIDAVERGFIEFSERRITQPERTVIGGDDLPGAYLVMPCAMSGPRILGAKLASIYPDNPRRNLPTICALYVLADYETGRVVAVMDAAYMTAVRTAAASAVATRALARPDARSIGLFGTGTQAEFHARAFAHMLPEATFQVLGTSADKSVRFADKLRSMLGIRCAPGASPQAVARCDIVVAATSARTPLFDGAEIPAGIHINGVGSHAPAIRELDSETIVRSRVIADSYAAVFAEAGDVLLPIEERRVGRDHVVAELGEVLAGKKPGRTTADDITLFKSNGIAFQDAVTARIALQRATERGLGTPFRFEN